MSAIATIIKYETTKYICTYVMYVLSVKHMCVLSICMKSQIRQLAM